MKFVVTMKDPDGVWDAIEETVAKQLEEFAEKLSDDEISALAEKRESQLWALLNKWFEFGEYISLEIDTEYKTIKVLERK